MIIAIDPGTEQSAIVEWSGSQIDYAAIHPNEGMANLLIKHYLPTGIPMAIEMVASYGMPVGREVFETVLWVGRFDQIWRHGRKEPSRLVYRRDVKLHLCQSARAKDANIRQALIDRFGKPGTKKQQGTTYGIKSHLWAAFALAVYAYDTRLGVESGQWKEQKVLA